MNISMYNDEIPNNCALALVRQFYMDQENVYGEARRASLDTDWLSCFRTAGDTYSWNFAWIKPELRETSC